MRARRIFWFGMHKVLKTTELPQLRALGFEVFNPAYISPVYDQSADRSIDRSQPTTLPPEVFDELLRHDFFYTEIPPRIAGLLNEYFDAAIVTINADWLAALMRAFRGQVIYRVYGQPFSLSEHFIAKGMWATLVERENFSIVPFAADSVEAEHQWFLDLCPAIVPYQIPDDVFEFSGAWAGRAHRPEVAVSIPNIENPYYRAAYDSFAADYPHRVFRIYGPQRSVPPDARIVGALDRREFLGRLAGASCYLYHYRDAVCYLPPIEMMEIGGPVIYAPGSLLARFFHGTTPGLIADQYDAEKKLRLLVSGDAGFVGEVVAAQADVKAKYDRNVVKPIFDRVFSGLLGDGRAAPALVRHAQAVMTSAGRAVGQPVPALAAPDRWIVIFLHIDGLFGYSKGRAYAFEGIPRVVDTIVGTLMAQTRLGVIVTCTVSALSVMYDFFHEHIHLGRIQLRAVSLGNHHDGFEARQGRLWVIEDLNARQDVACALVPHYYLFPEALLLSHPIVLYLPDYFPHLMPGAVFDVSADKDAENKEVGIAIARKAKAILTNSDFTKHYLPDAGFVAPDEMHKVIVAPLPLLGAQRAGTLTAAEEEALQARIAGRRFVFYPTANRPNKRIAFLLQTFAVMRLSHPDLALVLTCDLDSVPGVAAAAQQYGLANHLVFMPRVGEDVLAWLYRNAAALCLTSTLEGNMPPQVLEALSFGTPLVATRLPTITEALGGLSDQLLLCTPLDLQEFAAALHVTLSRRQWVVDRQAAVAQFLQERSSPKKFYGQLRLALEGAPALTQAA